MPPNLAPKLEAMTRVKIGAPAGATPAPKNREIGATKFGAKTRSNDPREDRRACWGDTGAEEPRNWWEHWSKRSRFSDRLI
jgi:hypothetical protein